MPCSETHGDCPLATFRIHHSDGNKQSFQSGRRDLVLAKIFLPCTVRIAFYNSQSQMWTGFAMPKSPAEL